ncbi:sacsin N-terminal ATP-binding-like domain-containing protein [Streptomyces sp. NPDC051644]|uniref:sacsin N-terminal ATP-binding-like domain-containing protein n=1 Tax=Streptomyces sp. NPDC051644 TaxID=3365666 RepID=UPI0037ACB82E
MSTIPGRHAQACWFSEGGTAITAMRGSGSGAGFGDAITALTRRRIEIFDGAGGDWRFAESLKSVSEDTAQEYEGRTILELIQNGHDALAAGGTGRIAVLAIRQEDGGGVLYVANEGTGFTEENFKAITELALSSKGAGEGIGNKGLGFRSVLQLTDWPEIYSKASPASDSFDGYCFRFARPDDIHAIVDDTALAARVIQDISPLALPVPAEVTDPVLKELAADGFSTVVRLPLRHDHAWGLVVAQAAEVVDDEAPLLLFLDRVRELVVEIRDADGGTRRVLSRAQRRSDLVESRSADWISEVDLGDAGRYLLARRTLEAEALHVAIERSVEVHGIDAKWLDWQGEAWVGVALRLDRPLSQSGRMYTFIPMSEASSAPFPGHVHAPFFTKLARLEISEAVMLNNLLLDQLAVLCVDLTRRLRSEAAHGRASDLVLDLMCWDTPVRLGKAVNGQLAAEPILPLEGGESWGTLRDTYAWPDGRRPWRVLTAEALARAGAPLLATSVGQVRHGRADRLAKAVVSRAMRPPLVRTADWVEAVAEEIRAEGGESTSPRWADFYNDVAQAFAGQHTALRGRRIILDQDGGLRPALGGAAEPGKKDKKEGTIFFHPGDEHADAVTRVPGDLKALRRRISFTHPDITWESPGRDFLQRGELVRSYQLDQVFNALDDLLRARPSEALSRDALTFALRQFPVLTRAQRDRLSRVAFRVPLVDGAWAKAAHCSLSPGWGTEGARRLERFLEAGGSRIPELAAQRRRWISGPDDWPAPVRDREAYLEFLTAIGVADGLRLSTVGDRLGAHHGNDLAPHGLAPRLGLGDLLSQAWVADVRSRWTKFAHPWTPYQFQRPLAHLPGATEVAGLGPTARREFAELLILGFRTWRDEVFDVTVHRPTYSFEDEHSWPTPFASFLRSTPWLPVEDAESDSPAFVTPGEAWFSTDGELPGFVPSLPLQTRRLLADKVAAARLRRCGLRRWEDPRHAGAAVRHLGEILHRGDVPSYLSVSFKKHYGRAWSHLAQNARWPWLPGEEVRLVVSRGNALGTCVPAAEDMPVHVCDEQAPLKEALVELAGHPVLVAGPESGDAIVEMADAHGIRTLRTSATDVQVRHRGGELITPTGHADTLIDGREWLVTVVALAVELKSGAFLRRSERGVRALLERLRTVRVVRADEVEVVISGVLTEPPPTTRALPLPDADHPTVVVWRSEEGWDELQACTSALAQLLGRPGLQDALELVLVKLERQLDTHDPERIDDRTLAMALDTTEAKVAEIRRNLTGDVHDTVRLLRPALCCLLGSTWDEESARVLDRAAGEDELVQIVGHYTVSLPVSPAELVALARSCTTPAELRDELGLDFQRFNEALTTLGPGYAPYSHPDLHEQAFGDFVRGHAGILVDRLRERYVAAARDGADLSAYAAARRLHDLLPDPDWLPRFVTPPEDEMRARTQAWLRSHDADDDLDRTTDLPPIDRLRELNTAALDPLVPALAQLVAAWCRRHGTPVPTGWQGAPLLEARTFLDGSGLSDLIELSEGQLLDVVRRGVGWPTGMPLTADAGLLGLTPADLAPRTGPAQGTAGPRGASPATIMIGEKEVTVGRDHFSAIADLASRTVDEAFLAQSGKVRLDTVAPVPQPGRGGSSGTSRVVVARLHQMSEDQRSAIGLVGEVAARAWLQRHYPEVYWRSGYAAVINGDREASDSLGYDFEVAWRDTTRLYEVKALSEPVGERVEFELGPSEVDAARTHARGGRYRILLITAALDPEHRQVFELPNPFSAAGRERFRIVGKGLRYQCSPLRNSRRP